MTNRAFIGSIEPQSGVGSPYGLVVGPVFVMDSNSNLVYDNDSRPDFYTYIAVGYNFDYGTIRALTEQQIRDQWGDQTIEMFWINDFGMNIDPTVTTPTRSLNSVFKPSTTRFTVCEYTVELAVSATLLTSQSITVDLLSDSNNPPTTSRGQTRNSTGALVGLQTTCRHQMTTVVKKNDYVKLSTGGNGTATLISSAEYVF